MQITDLYLPDGTGFMWFIAIFGGIIGPALLLIFGIVGVVVGVKHKAEYPEAKQAGAVFILLGGFILTASLFNLDTVGHAQLHEGTVASVSTPVPHGRGLAVITTLEGSDAPLYVHTSAQQAPSLQELEGQSAAYLCEYQSSGRSGPRYLSCNITDAAPGSPELESFKREHAR